VAFCGSMLSPRYAWQLVSAVAHHGLLIASQGVEPMWLGYASYALTGFLTVGTLAMHFLLRDSSLEEFFERVPASVRVAITTVMLYLIIISMTGEDNAFIYFQF